MKALRYLVGAFALAGVAGCATPGMRPFGTRIEPDAGREYLVIDLAAGPHATRYPIRYMDRAPRGGWTDEYKTTKLVLRRIPAGTFTMGSPTNELGRAEDGEEQRTITLTKDFFIGVYEVTQRQWELVTGNRPARFHNNSFYQARPVEWVSYHDIRENARKNAALTWNWPGNTWAGRSSFVGKLRMRTWLATLDLPTEAQWEYACRAETTTALNSGQDLTNESVCPNLSALGRYRGNHPPRTTSDYTPDDCSPANGTAEAGSFLPNAWGLYDMHGNVSEWCLDWISWDFDIRTSATDPVGAQSGWGRVLRGGNWGSSAGMCRSAAWRCEPPDTRHPYYGFRLAVTVAPQ